MVCVEGNQKSVGLKFLFDVVSDVGRQQGGCGRAFEDSNAAVGVVNHVPGRGPNIPKGTAGSVRRTVLLREGSRLDNR